MESWGPISYSHRSTEPLANGQVKEKKYAN
jgi:hypothetical protein